MKRVLFEKIVVVHLVKKSFDLYGIPRLNIVFKEATIEIKSDLTESSPHLAKNAPNSL
jgi:hypothetical protein